jgi:cytoskeletal protein CcmA (bactofilin family)
MKNTPAGKSSFANYLSDAVKINGMYTSENDAIIAGTIEGDVHVNGVLTLDKKGFITGKIIATEIDIAGKVQGELRCDGKVTLRDSAIINGDIHVKSLQVEANAFIDGVIHMSKNGK